MFRITLLENSVLHIGNVVRLFSLGISKHLYFISRDNGKEKLFWQNGEKRKGRFKLDPKISVLGLKTNVSTFQELKRSFLIYNSNIARLLTNNIGAIPDVSR